MDSPDKLLKGAAHLAAIETYSKFHIIRDHFPNFNDVMGRLRDNLLLRRSGLLRADLFVGRQTNEAVAIMVYDRAQDFLKTDTLVREFFSELAGISSVTSEIMGSIFADASLDLADCYAREHKFAFGIGSSPTPPSFVRGPSTIEACSQFQLRPEQLENYKRLAANMVQFAKRSEPGTLRFDWFFDDATLHGFVMKSFSDAEALSFHMANCQRMRTQLSALVPTTTDFLGSPPLPSSSDIPDWTPYFLAFHASLISLG